MNKIKNRYCKLFFVPVIFAIIFFAGVSHAATTTAKTETGGAFDGATTGAGTGTGTGTNKTKGDDEITRCEYGNDEEYNCYASQKEADMAELTAPGDVTITNPAGTSGGATFTNPLSYTTVEELLSGILSAIQKIIVVLALVFIAIGALMILVSAGSPETVEKGKKAITMAIVGLAIGIAAPSILKELAGILGWGTTTPLPADVVAATTLSQIALNVLSFLLGVTGVLALIMLVTGAIMYLTSAGDEERVETGKKIFKNALIGVVIVMASMVLVKQIAYFFIVS